MNKCVYVINLGINQNPQKQHIQQSLMKILILGAYGQVGLELIRAMYGRFDPNNILCSDLNDPPKHADINHHIKMDALDAKQVEDAIEKHNITQIYCLPAILSATGQKNPILTEKINMGSLFVTLEAARKYKLEKVFWPSSIAAFGSDTPKDTPQQTIMNPTTVYGITKKSGELWCQYYFNKYGVDVRSIRYPGLVGYRSLPGGGTTDYAVDIFHKAVKGETFECYLNSETRIPMIYTDDAIDGTLQLMEAPKQKLTVRTSYNFGSMNFNPRELADEIKKNLPNFKIEYKIDPVKQQIADSWPHNIIDDVARRDWGWTPKYNLQKMTKVILQNLKPL